MTVYRPIPSHLVHSDAWELPSAPAGTCHYNLGHHSVHSCMWTRIPTGTVFLRMLTAYQVSALCHNLRQIRNYSLSLRQKF